MAVGFTWLIATWPSGRKATGQYKRDEPNPTFFNGFVAAQRAFKFIRRRAFDLMRAGSGKPEVTLRSRRLLLLNRAPSAFQKLLLQSILSPRPTFFLSFAKQGRSSRNMKTISLDDKIIFALCRQAPKP
jgi:hypothetical protein